MPQTSVLCAVENRALARIYEKALTGEGYHVVVVHDGEWALQAIEESCPDEILLDVSSGYGPYTGTITVPGDAVAGNTRMRVRVNYNAPPPACGTTSYGEAEDYTINVGGEQSTLTIDPAAIDFGTVPVDAEGSSVLTLGADGSAPINFSIGVEYGAKASVGGGQCDPTLRSSPFEGTGFTAAAQKDPNQLLFEGFEAGVPPAGWTTIVTWTSSSANMAGEIRSV